MGSMVSGKKLNTVGVELEFSSNTSKAAKDIQNLQSQIDKLLKVRGNFL